MTVNLSLGGFQYGPQPLFMGLASDAVVATGGHSGWVPVSDNRKRRERLLADARKLREIIQEAAREPVGEEIAESSPDSPTIPLPTPSERLIQALVQRQLLALPPVETAPTAPQVASEPAQPVTVDLAATISAVVEQIVYELADDVLLQILAPELNAFSEVLLAEVIAEIEDQIVEIVLDLTTETIYATLDSLTKVH